MATALGLRRMIFKFQIFLLSLMGSWLTDVTMFWVTGFRFLSLLEESEDTVQVDQQGKSACSGRSVCVLSRVEPHPFMSESRCAGQDTLFIMTL